MAQSPGSSASRRAALSSSVTQEPDSRQAAVKGLGPDVTRGDVAVTGLSHFSTSGTFLLSQKILLKSSYMGMLDQRSRNAV